MTPITRRIAMALTLCASATLAQAQGPAGTWPTGPVKIVVPFPAGGSTDLTAREVAQGLTQRFGQPFIVENRPGAASTLGTAAVAKAPADGYTFLITSSHFAIVPGLYKQLPYDPVKDLRGVSLLVNLPVILVATPKLPVKTVAELIEYDKKNPGKLNFGSSGNGGVNHLSGELFNSLAMTSLKHIPYKGTAPAMQDLIGGHVQLMFDAVSTSLPNIQAGLIKPIAWTGAKRSATLPDLPTIAESGVKGYESTSWLAMFAPAGTPPEIVKLVSAEVRTALNKPDVHAKQVAMGAEVVTSTPEQLDATVRSEMAKWSQLINKLGVKAE
ncbi:MAG: tripartite tricarboxylate transporter substrate binding protein [Comamonadaceae bacterium]|nr:MAG: tripartite tricarboxylate transporter substrate binding protein [Comamonadaceae bacterium]